MISPRALGALFACVFQDVRPTREALQSHFKHGGKHYWDETTRELENAGYLRRGRDKVGQQYNYEVEITQHGRDYLQMLIGFDFPTSAAVGFSDSLIQQFNTKYINILNSKQESEGKKDTLRHVESEINEGMNMGGWEGIFDSTGTDDYEQEIAEQKARAQQDVIAQKEAKAAVRQAIRGRKKHLTKWTSTDIAYEFSDRVRDLWNIPPWQVGKTNFISALSHARKIYSTNGEVEYLMVDLFFRSISHDKFTNAEKLWRTFIKQFAFFHEQANAMLRTDTQKELASTQAKQSQKWLEDE